MKRYLTYILLIISSICYGQIYSTSNRMYGTMSTPLYDNYKNINGGSNVSYSSPNIGYSTSRYGMTNTYNMYERQYNNVYSGTYNPGSSGRPSGHRKVKGVNANGETIGNGNRGHDSDFWENEYEYWWDSTNNCWWRRSINGGPWERYRTFLGLGLIGWDWHSNDGSPSNNISQGWQNINSIPHPYDPNPTPIGEFPIGLLLILSFLFVYKKFKNKLIEL